jgi:hypothetical protein
MVHQSKKYRDESKRLYLDAVEILNRTSALERSVMQNAKRTAAFEEESREGANSSMSSAILCKSYLDQVRSEFNKTTEIYNKVKILADNVTNTQDSTNKSTEINLSVRSLQI